MRSRARLLVGLTGGIGSGKSLALSRFKRGGALAIACDDIAHEQALPGAAGYRAIRRAFGKPVLDAGGSLDRAKLSALVFARPRARKRLESLTHPLILRELRRRARAAEGVVVADVPLLFERRLEREFDLTVLVTAPRGERLKRLERRGVGRDEALRRMAAQLPDAAKAKRADVVVPNDGTKSGFVRRVGQYHRAFTLMQRSPT